MQMNEVQLQVIRRMKALNRTEKTAHMIMATDTKMEEEDLTER